MATNTLAASRRAVILGLAGTAAFAGTIRAAIAAPVTKTTDRTKWERRLAIYRHRLAAEEAFHARYVKPVTDDYARRFPEGSRPASEEQRRAFDRCLEAEGGFDDCVSKTSTARENLLLSPAPDHDAVALKLRITMESEQFDCGGINHIGEALMADMARLGARAA